MSSNLAAKYIQVTQSVRKLTEKCMSIRRRFPVKVLGLLHGKYETGCFGVSIMGPDRDYMERANPGRGGDLITKYLPIDLIMHLTVHLSVLL